MTLEAQITALTGEVTKMLDKIDKSRSEALKGVVSLSRSFPYRYQVAVDVEPTTKEQEELGIVKSSQSFADIMAKINKDRAAPDAGVTGIDLLTTPKPVTIIVQSFSDALPLKITEPNVEVIFSRSAVFKIVSQGPAIMVTARDVTITGGTFAFKTKRVGDQAITSTPGLRTEVRSARFVNHNPNDGLIGVDFPAPDLTVFDL